MLARIKSVLLGFLLMSGLQASIKEIRRKSLDIHRNILRLEGVSQIAKEKSQKERVLSL